MEYETTTVGQTDDTGAKMLNPAPPPGRPYPVETTDEKIARLKLRQEEAGQRVKAHEYAAHLARAEREEATMQLRAIIGEPHYPRCSEIIGGAIQLAEKASYHDRNYADGTSPATEGYLR